MAIRLLFQYIQILPGLIFRSLLSTTYDCLFHAASWPVPFLPWCGIAFRSLHWQVLYMTVGAFWGYHSTHTSNMLPQFFFLDSFSFNYFVRFTWFVLCFGLKQKYFTSLGVSHFPCLSTLLHLKIS